MPTLEQIENEKEQLEYLLREAVAKIVDEWNRRDLHLPIRSINIQIANVTSMGGPTQTIVTDCDVDFGIRL